MNTFFSISLSAVGISCISLIGALLFFFTERTLQRILLFLVAFSAGSLIGAALLHLLPEGLENSSMANPFLYIVLGFVLFYIVERLIHSRHTMRTKEHTHLGTLSLFADAFHNFLDGIILASAFIVNPQLGFVTAFAVASHEIPQEIAEFGVLLYSGFQKTKALLFNFISATTIILGGLTAFLLRDFIGEWTGAFLLLGTGTFLYLGASAFMPEIREREEAAKTIGLFLVFLAGLGLMWFLAQLE